MRTVATYRFHFTPKFRTGEWLCAKNRGQDASGHHTVAYGEFRRHWVNRSQLAAIARRGLCAVEGFIGEREERLDFNRRVAAAECSCRARLAKKIVALAPVE